MPSTKSVARIRRELGDFERRAVSVPEAQAWHQLQQLASGLPDEALCAKALNPLRELSAIPMSCGGVDSRALAFAHEAFDLLAVGSGPFPKLRAAGNIHEALHYIGWPRRQAHSRAETTVSDGRRKGGRLERERAERRHERWQELFDGLRRKSPRQKKLVLAERVASTYNASPLDFDVGKTFRARTVCDAVKVRPRGG